MSSSVLGVELQNKVQSRITSLKKELEQIGEKMVTQNKYHKLEDIYKDGKNELYASAVNDLILVDEFISNSRYIKSIVSSQDSQIDSLITMITELRSDVQNIDQLSGQDLDIFPRIIENAFSIVGSILNHREGSTYVFGGMHAGSKPVDTELLFSKTNFINGKVSRNYTDVLDRDYNVNLGFNTKINMDINASNPAFQELIGALHLAKDFKDYGNFDQRRKIIESLDSAMDKMLSVKADISSNIKAIEGHEHTLKTKKIDATKIIDQEFKEDQAASVEKELEVFRRMQSYFHQISSQYDLILANFL